MEIFKGGLTRFWWAPMVTGIIAIGLGVWCLCSPATSIPVLAYVFAALICVAGGFNLGYGIINRRIAHNWGWSLALGLLDLVAGIWLFTLPEAELATTFIIVVGIWLICITINAFCETFMFSSGSPLWTTFSLILLLITIWFAFILISNPVSMAVAGWLYLGISLIAYGVFRVSVAGKIRSINRITRGRL